MTTFYTGKGDAGFTDLLGDRVPKYHHRPETLGAIDEATCQIGLGRATAQSDETRSILINVQRDLYTMMAELAFTAEVTQGRYHITQEHLDTLEQETDRIGDQLDLPSEFILPGDTLPGATLDVARTVVRRAERLATRLLHDKDIENELIIAYLNRLSSLLFVLARYEDHVAGVTTTRAKQP